MALQQYRLGGTYYGYDPSSGKLVAFATPDQLKQYFPSGINPSAPTLPSSVNVSTANKTPGVITTVSSPTQTNQTTNRTTTTTNTSINTSGLKQYHVGGTYYGYNSQTGQLVAFASPDQLKKFFPGGIDPNAPPLPSGIDPSAANKTPGVLTGGAPAGVDPNLWKQLSPADQAFVGSMDKLAQNQYQQGQANFGVNAQTMQKALELAQNDPTLKAIYGDNAKMALSDLHNSLGFLNAEYAQQFGLMTAEQAKARKDLAEQEAAAGRAQSGFRQQAQGMLQKQQSAVIASSQRQLQQQVRSLGAAYESQFGSKGLPAIQAGGATYQPYGGITGSQPIAQKQATEQKQQEIYGTIANPLNK